MKTFTLDEAQALVPVLESCVEAHRGRAKTKELSLTFEAGDIDAGTLVLACAA